MGDRSVASSQQSSGEPAAAGVALGSRPRRAESAWSRSDAGNSSSHATHRRAVEIMLTEGVPAPMMAPSLALVASDVAAGRHHSRPEAVPLRRQPSGSSGLPLGSTMGSRVPTLPPYSDGHMTQRTIEAANDADLGRSLNPPKSVASGASAPSSRGVIAQAKRRLVFAAQVVAFSTCLPTDTFDTKTRKALLTLTSVFCQVAGIFWGSAYTLVGFPVAGAFPFLFVLSSFLGTVQSVRYKSIALNRAVFLTLMTILPLGMHIAMGGAHGNVAPSFVLLWSLLAPTFALWLFETPWVAAGIFGVQFSAFVFIIIGLQELDLDIGAPRVEPEDLPRGVEAIFLIANLAFPIACSLLLLAVMQVRIRQQTSAIDAILHNVYPPTVADEVRAMGEGAARARMLVHDLDSVALLFLDIVGFSALSSRVPPAEVVSDLNRLWAQCDSLCAFRGVTKLKCVADMYIACCGIEQVDGVPATPAETQARCRAILETALDFVDLANNSFFLGEPCRVRVGLHVGHVTGGLFGLSRTSFDLIGAHVNVCCRMEQTGRANRIQATRSFVHGLFAESGADFKPVDSPLWKIVRRGVVHAKGCGDMETFWIARAAREGAAPDEDDASESGAARTESVSPVPYTTDPLPPISVSRAATPANLDHDTISLVSLSKVKEAASE